MRQLTVSILLLASSASLAQPIPCGMTLDFQQPDNNGKTRVAVWRDTAASALLFADTMNINTDGTRRSYSVDDFWGEKQALNNLCNAMSDACDGLSSEQLKQRRIVTQAAKASNWPASQTAATRISPSIIPFRNGKPCPEVGGYLVSATALHKPKIADPCNIDNYADALTVPAIVLPKRASKKVATPFEAAGAEIGDLVVTMKAGSNSVHYAVVGDKGPARSLGEISVALAGDLLGKTAPPQSYQEIRGRGSFKGKGWVVGRTFTLIFPKTRNSNDPHMTRVRIEQEAAARFKAWGGLNRLKACAAAYK